MNFKRNGGFISVTRDIFDNITLPNTAIGIYNIPTQNYLKGRLRWPFPGHRNDYPGSIVQITGTSKYIIPFGIIKIDYLLIAGGGGGGATGGGGAGGLLLGTSYDVEYGDELTITIGAGGAGVHDRTSGSPVQATVSCNGANSSFQRANVVTPEIFGTVTAIGGGSGDTPFTGDGGGPSPLNSGMLKGSNGGSGGGSGSNGGVGPGILAGGTGVSGQGNAGGSGGGYPGSGSGGGGGAGAAGNGGSPSGGGTGGAGLQVPWASPYGSPAGYFAGGGGGGCFNAPRVARAGGVGGGGTGVRYTDGLPAGSQDGVTNTGSGGGGNARNLATAGSGGSGVLILKLYDT